MKTTWKPAIPLLLALAACDVPATGSTSGSTSGGVGFVPVSESVAAMAAPNQDLNKVRIAPEDGCYYYLWDGPVEATYLPLRTTEGRPICTQAAS